MVKSRERRTGKTESAHAGGVESKRLKREKKEILKKPAVRRRKDHVQEFPPETSIERGGLGSPIQVCKYVYAWDPNHLSERLRKL
jgi:hypothetical protein